MASRLFRAVVGVGISFGAASAACFGAVDDVKPGSDAGASPDAAVSSTTAPPSPPSSTGSGDDADVPPSDAAADAPKDAGPDAFCDAAWPTTKGNPGPPACIDPNGECADAGLPTYCWQDDGDGGCSFGGSFAPFCVGGQWRCQAGTIPAGDCR